MNLRTARLAPRCLLLLTFFLVLSLWASAEDTAARFADYPFLLRLEHTMRSSSQCVLLQRTGDFHLEHTRGEQTLVLEGRITEAELLKLKSWLDSDELRRLAQPSIVSPLLYQMDDRLQINVFREDHWQNLVFPDSTSQAPHREVLKPLVGWLNALRDEPHRELSEDEGKNHCLPPEKLQLKIRSNHSATTSGAEKSGAPDAVAGSSTQQTFLMRYSRDRVSNGTLERICVIVNRAGHFRMEKGSQPATFKMKTSVYEGSIAEDEVEDLARRLDVPALKNLQHQNRISALAVHDADVISLSVPRSSDTQELVFSGYVGIQSRNDAVTNATDDTTPIEPIQKWLEASIESQKLTSVKSARPDHCAAAP